MRHQHFDPDANEFFEHDHVHSGPHQHSIELVRDQSYVITVKGPGNYAPARKQEQS